MCISSSSLYEQFAARRNLYNSVILEHNYSCAVGKPALNALGAISNCSNSIHGGRTKRYRERWNNRNTLLSLYAFPPARCGAYIRLVYGI